MTETRAAPVSDADVAIVGGGMVGLTLAVALAEAGLKVAVVDHEDPAVAVAAPFDGRVSAIALAAQRMLATLGLWRLVDEAEPILDIRVADGDSLLFLHYDHRDVGAEPFGWMLENRLFRVALYRRSPELPNLRLMAPARVAGVERGAGFVTVRLEDGAAIRAPLVVGAEGRRSPLRDSAGVRVVAWDYRQTGIVCTVRHARPHHGTAIERFLPAGPFAILPMTGNRSSLVWTEPTELAAALIALPGDQLTAEMARRFGDHLGALGIEGPIWSYPLSLQLAERYTDHRLVLAGDAAHGIHPIAGQGLNLGLRDVAALAEVLVEARRLGLDIGAADVLARYERWRRFDALVLGAVTDGLNRLFSNDLAPVKLARDLGLAAVDKLPPLKRLFMRHAMGTLGDLPRLLQGAPL